MSAAVATMFLSAWVLLDGRCDARLTEAMTDCRAIATLQGVAGQERLEWAVQRSCLQVAGWTQVPRSQAQAWRRGCADGVTGLALTEAGPTDPVDLLRCQMASVAWTPEGSPFVDRAAARACVRGADELDGRMLAER